MRHDERLIELFLRGYKDYAGLTYHFAERPDREERNKPAIDCVAVNDWGESLAIEHTLVEPFEGLKLDDQRFLKVFGRLHHSPELTVQERLIDVLVPVGAIPNGVDWEEVAQRVFEWFREERLKIPVGESDYKIPGLKFELALHVEVMEIPGTPGVVVTGRIRPKDKLFSDVLRKALETKLPKLVAVHASNRILLLEDGSMALGTTVFSREIDSSRGCFPELAHLHSVWLAHTALWDSEKMLWFVHVWPNGVGQRFTIKDA